MYRRKNFQYADVPKKFTLNITSMADMFTILLVFLLQNYSLSEVKLELIPNLNLPISSSFLNPTKLPVIFLSKDEVRLGEQKVVAVKDISDQSSQIDPLYQALVDYKSRLPDGEKDKGEIILQADKDHSYQIIQKIMATASVAGFPKLKLATLSGE